MKVLVVDQFSGFTPYWLQEHPTRFDDLCDLAVNHEPQTWVRHVAQILDVEESYVPPFATITYRADAHGMAEVWKLRVDSSG